MNWWTKCCAHECSAGCTSPLPWRILQQGAPLVTSLLIAGAVGSAITSDLGARTVREEIDALEGDGHLAGPAAGRAPAARRPGPPRSCLTVIVAMTAMIDGLHHERRDAGSVSSGAYLGSFVSFSNPSDLVVAEAKALRVRIPGHDRVLPTGLDREGGPKGVAEAGGPKDGAQRDPAGRFANVLITQAYVLLIPQRIT